MKENITLKVDGMFCSHCESKIENKLLSLKGISYVKASFVKEEVNLIFDNDIVSQKEIEKNILDLDYRVVKDKKEINIQIICILIIVLALYMIFKHLGLLNVFNFFPTVETTMSYGMLFLVGLLTSVHCIAMCGGINLSQSITSYNTIQSNFYYNLGRVISYTAIGGIVGVFGSTITLNGRFKGTVAIIAGILMIIMAINMLGVFPVLRIFNVRIPKKISVFLNRSKKGKSSFYIGLVNGLMPCGPLQSMQLYALSTGSFLGGATSMFLFSLGTVPLMFGFGTIASQLNKKFTKRMLTVSSVIIFILGFGMLNNGLSLSGVSLNMSNTYENVAEVNGDYQTIETEIDYGSYEAITVKKDILVKWIINVPKGKLNGCNNEMIISAYGLDIKLKEGQNIIEFIPTETGTVPYSCWMGMIKSSINVID